MDETSSLIDEIINVRKREPTDEELDSFKNLANDYIKYDDQIRKLEIALKERKNHQRAISESMIKFMTVFEYNDLNTQHGRIKINKKECKVPIKMTDIKAKIMKHDDTLYKQIFEEETEKVMKQNLKRIIPKVLLTI